MKQNQLAIFLTKYIHDGGMRQSHLSWPLLLSGCCRLHSHFRFAHTFCAARPMQCTTRVCMHYARASYNFASSMWWEWDTERANKETPNNGTRDIQQLLLPINHFGASLALCAFGIFLFYVAMSIFTTAGDVDGMSQAKRGRTICVESIFQFKLNRTLRWIWVKPILLCSEVSWKIFLENLMGVNSKWWGDLINRERETINQSILS